MKRIEDNVITKYLCPFENLQAFLSFLNANLCWQNIIKCDHICVPQLYSNSCQAAPSYKWHHMFHVNPTALSQAGRHMEDSIMATLLLGILGKHNPVRVSQFTPYHWFIIQLYLYPETIIKVGIAQNLFLTLAWCNWKRERILRKNFAHWLAKYTFNTRMVSGLHLGIPLPTLPESYFPPAPSFARISLPSLP